MRKMREGWDLAAPVGAGQMEECHVRLQLSHIGERALRIVVLDGHALNPGDLSWDPLRALGECAIHDRTSLELTVERLRGAGIAVTNKAVLSRPVISQLPELRYIGVTATGYNIVDVAAAAERRIVVTNVPAYGTASVAQMTFALLLELTLRVGHHSDAVRGGRWTQSPDFSFFDYPLIELDGLTMGLVGFGRIGQAVARMARAFGMKVLVHVRTPRPGPPDVTFTDLETLFRESDVVSLHCPLTPETQGMVNGTRLALMKPTAYLINTGRGPLVNEADLAAALNAGRIAGAGLDVLAVEPARGDNPLLAAKNCIITPHVAWATCAARQRLMNETVENIRSFLAGRPRNVVG